MTKHNPMSDEAAEDRIFDLERATRHHAATFQSDVRFVREQLMEASRRFSDIADHLEQAGQCDQVSFLRASAARYKRVAERSLA